MSVERDRIVEVVDAETMLGEARNVRTEQPAAGGHDQPVVGERLSLAFGGRRSPPCGTGVDRLGAASHVDDVDGLEDILQRRRQRLGLRLIEPRADHQCRLGCNQRDLEVLGRNALDVAQAGCGKCCIHAGEAGADDDESHVIHSSGLGFRNSALASTAAAASSDAKTRRVRP